MPSESLATWMTASTTLYSQMTACSQASLSLMVVAPMLSSAVIGLDCMIADQLTIVAKVLSEQHPPDQVLL